MAFADWSTNPANNGVVSGVTYWPEGMQPGQVNDTGRQMMADMAIWRDAPNFPNSLTVGGKPVWTTGNLPSPVQTTGAAFTSTISAPRIIAANGDLQAYRPGGNTGALYLANDNTHYLLNDGANYQLAGGGNLIINGNGVWHTGNLNPNAYAPLSGANFSGTISVPNINIGSGWQVGVIGGRLVFLLNGSVVVSFGSDGIRTTGNVSGSTTP